MKRLITTFVLISLFLPNISYAQRFTPGAQDQSSTGRTFSGVNFSGVGGALASCLGVGQWAGKGINKLTDKIKKKKPSGASKGLLAGIEGTKVDGNVPTFDSAVKDEQKEQNTKENCLDAAAYAASRQAIQSITNQTLNWVNTGFGGNPLYVRNTQSFLRSIENDQIKNFISSNTNPLLGTTTGQAVNNSILSMIAGRKPAQNTTTSTDPFISDFSQGGWSSFFKLIDPVNNPVSQVLTQSQKLQNDILQQKTDINNLLLQGQGMLPQQKCVEYAKISPKNTDVQTADQSMDNIFNQQNNQPGSSKSDRGKNPDGTDRCIKYETVTPGSIIAEQVKNVTTSPVRQLEQADEINEIIGSYFDTLLNTLFNQGLGALGRSRDNFGNNLSGFGGFGSNTIVGSGGQTLSSTKNASGITGSDFNISNPKNIHQVLQTQYNYLTSMTDSESKVQKIVPVVGRLDYCFPGPNISWQDGFGLSFGSFQGAIGGGRLNPSGTYTKLNPYTLSDNIFNFEKTKRDETFELLNSPVTVTVSPMNIVSSLLSFKAPDLYDTSAVLSQLSLIFDDWATSYQEMVSEQFNTNAIVEAFGATANTTTEKAIIRTETKKMAKEVANLSGYVSSTAEIVDEYSDTRDETLINIQRLEAIDKKVLDIVTTAKARYIKEKKDQGITINLTCLNRVYDTTSTPIKIKPQKESDPAPELKKLEEYKKAFYDAI